MAVSKKKTALTHATVIGGAWGMEPQEEMTVLVEAGRIVSVGRGLAVPMGFDEIEVDGRYLFPGLVNLHARITESGFLGRRQRDPVKEARRLMATRFGRMIAFNRCAAFARTELLSGVTTLRSPGSLGNIDRRLKDAIDGGSVLGPRLIVSNMAIATASSLATNQVACVAHSDEDCALLAAKMIAGEADELSLMVAGEAPGSAGMVRSAVHVAEAAGRKVAAECDSSEAASIALRNGASLIILKEPTPLTDDLPEYLRLRNAALVRPITPIVAAITARRKETGEKSRDELDILVGGIKSALDEGVTVGLGTNPGIPYATHYDMWRELEYFRRFVGASREDILRMATFGNAGILGLDKETGSIEEGKSADLVVTNRSPLVDLETIREPYLVMFRGSVMMPPKPMKNTASEEALDSIMRELW